MKDFGQRWGFSEQSGPLPMEYGCHQLTSAGLLLKYFTAWQALASGGDIPQAEAHLPGPCMAQVGVVVGKARIGGEVFGRSEAQRQAMHQLHVVGGDGHHPQGG